MSSETARARAMAETRDRILDVAIEILGRDPEAGMGDVAAGAGVVRRTVYGHFPTRADLVRTLTQRAVEELAASLVEVDSPDRSPEEAWVDFVGRLWPVMRRYRVLLALRRGEYGQEIHALLRPVDDLLADLVRRGQDRGAFGRYLAPGILSQVAYSAVFSIADQGLADGSVHARASAVTSLLVLGVPEARAAALASERLGG